MLYLCKQLTHCPTSYQKKNKFLFVTHWLGILSDKYTDKEFHMEGCWGTDLV